MKFLICLALVSVASAYYTGGTKGGAQVSDSAALLGLTRSRGGESASASVESSGSSGASYGSSSSSSQSSNAGASFASSASEWAAGGSSQQVSGPLTAAVVTRYNVQYVDVPTQRQAPQPQEIIIPASRLPLAFTFESAASPVQVSQRYTPGEPSEPQSEEYTEPDQVLRSTVSKNLIHEITESIQPVRRITQEVKPVLEEVNQLIARGQEVQGVQATSQVQASSQGSYAQEASQDETALLGASRVQQVQQELIERRRRAKKRAAIISAIRRARA